MRMSLLFGVKTVVDSNRGRLETCRGARFNPRRPARRQANPPYLLPAYTLHSRARRSLENSVDPNRDPNADRSRKHRTVLPGAFCIYVVWLLFEYSDAIFDLSGC